MDKKSLFLVEAQPEVRYVHTTLYSVKITRYLQVSHLQSKMAKPRHIFSALTSEKTESEKQIALSC